MSRAPEIIDEEVLLIEQAKKDPDAFGLLYERYVEKIYTYISFRVQAVHDVEELTAKVFYKALSNIRRYRHMGLPFSAWLYRIAHNQVANYYRDKSRVREISIDALPIPNLLSRQPAPEAAVQREMQTEYLMMILRDLPARKQELIFLKFVENLSNAEIAKIFNKSESSVKSSYHRTLLELRGRLDRELFGETTERPVNHNGGQNGS